MCVCVCSVSVSVFGCVCVVVCVCLCVCVCVHTLGCSFFLTVHWNFTRGHRYLALQESARERIRFPSLLFSASTMGTGSEGLQPGMRLRFLTRKHYGDAHLPFASLSQSENYRNNQKLPKWPQMTVTVSVWGSLGVVVYV